MKLTKNQQKWIDALRSGKYKQGKGTLKTKNKEGEICYCCLGVAQELFEPESPRIRLKDLYGSTNGTMISEQNTPSGNAVIALNLKDFTGQVDHSKKSEDCSFPFDTLAEANDGIGSCPMTFEEIANFIESNPQAVFDEGAD